MAEREVTDLITPDVWNQTCFACRHASFGEMGTYCTVFKEAILQEDLAGADCPSFVSADGKAYVNVDPQ